ncbi:MAG: lysophospholipid acyltransferase family protein, partial [Polyangiaceae bacterium]
GSSGPWQRAIGLRRGVVIAGSHTGNWDLAACATAKSVELCVVTKRLSVRSLDRFWQSTRARQGIKLVDPRGALSIGRVALARGAAVVMMIDQVPASPRHALGVTFLGQRAMADRGPAALAAVRRAPLVVAASRRDARGGHLLYVLDVLVPPARPTRRWIDDATRASTRALDAFVRAHPSQWLWLHRRWKAVDPQGSAATLGG